MSPAELSGPIGQSVALLFFATTLTAVAIGAAINAAVESSGSMRR